MLPQITKKENCEIKTNCQGDGWETHILTSLKDKYQSVINFIY